MDCYTLIKTVSCFPNNKPWITSDIKAILNQKKEAFRDGDKETGETWIEEEIKEGKGRIQKDDWEKFTKQQHPWGVDRNKYQQKEKATTKRKDSQ